MEGNKVNYFYLALQYSGIQKTILRHDRLWSIAGTSMLMARMNEILMLSKKIIGENSEVILAGGGKLIVKFINEDDAKKAKRKIKKLVSTTLPMLEYQISEIVPAENVIEALEKKNLNNKKYPGPIRELNEQKRCFRGYAVTFNPHFKVCEECGDYPATSENLCSICYDVKNEAKISIKDLMKNNQENKKLIPIEAIYKQYISDLKIDSKEIDIDIPMDFENLFKEKEDKKRLAVWVSDVNGMGDKLPVWVNQEEKSIKRIFKEISKFNQEVLVKTLLKVFTFDKFINKNEKFFMPFRLIVAGGDDLCVVMREEDIIDFTLTFSYYVNNIEKPEYLKIEWLRKEAERIAKQNPNLKISSNEFNNHSFGGAFVITSVHTPFKKIHNVAEDLMSLAKEKTNRKGNSINWKILATDTEPLSDLFFKLEKPIFIEDDLDPNHLTFKKYCELVNEYKNISSSKVHQIVSLIFEANNDSKKLEKLILSIPSARSNTSYIRKILTDKHFRDHDNNLMPSRIATLLELLSIKRRGDEQ